MFFFFFSSADGFLLAAGLKGDSGFETDGSGDSFGPREKVFNLMDLYIHAYAHTQYYFS